MVGRGCEPGGLPPASSPRCWKHPSSRRRSPPGVWLAFHDRPIAAFVKRDPPIMHPIAMERARYALSSDMEKGGDPP